MNPLKFYIRNIIVFIFFVGFVLCTSDPAAAARRSEKSYSNPQNSATSATNVFMPTQMHKISYEDIQVDEAQTQSSSDTISQSAAQITTQAAAQTDAQIATEGLKYLDIEAAAAYLSGLKYGVTSDEAYYDLGGIQQAQSKIGDSYSDCLDRATYLFNIGEELGLNARIIILYDALDRKGHAVVEMDSATGGREIFDSVSGEQYESLDTYTAQGYRAVATADSLEQLTGVVQHINGAYNISESDDGDGDDGDDSGGYDSGTYSGDDAYGAMCADDNSWGTSSYDGGDSGGGGQSGSGAYNAYTYTGDDPYGAMCADAFGGGSSWASDTGYSSFTDAAANFAAVMSSPTATMADVANAASAMAASAASYTSTGSWTPSSSTSETSNSNLSAPTSGLSVAAPGVSKNNVEQNTVVSGVEKAAVEVEKGVNPATAAAGTKIATETRSLDGTAIKSEERTYKSDGRGGYEIFDINDQRVGGGGFFNLNNAERDTNLGYFNPGHEKTVFSDGQVTDADLSDLSYVITKGNQQIASGSRGSARDLLKDKVLLESGVKVSQDSMKVFDMLPGKISDWTRHTNQLGQWESWYNRDINKTVVLVHELKDDAGKTVVYSMRDSKGDILNTADLRIKVDRDEFEKVGDKLSNSLNVEQLDYRLKEAASQAGSDVKAQVSASGGITFTVYERAKAPEGAKETDEPGEIIGKSVYTIQYDGQDKAVSYTRDFESLQEKGAGPVSQAYNTGNGVVYMTPLGKMDAADYGLPGKTVSEYVDRFYSDPRNSNAPQMDKDFTKRALNEYTQSKDLYSSMYVHSGEQPASKDATNIAKGPSAIFEQGTNFFDWNSDGKIDYNDVNQNLGRLVQDPDGIVQWARDQGVQFDNQGNIIQTSRSNDIITAIQENKSGSGRQLTVEEYAVYISGTNALEKGAVYDKAAMSAMDAVMKYGDERGQVNQKMLVDEVNYGGKVPDSIKAQTEWTISKQWEEALQYGIGAPVMMLGGTIVNGGVHLLEGWTGVQTGSLQTKLWSTGVYQWTGGLFNVPMVAVFGKSLSDPYSTQTMSIGERYTYLKDHPLELVEYGLAVYGGVGLLNGMFAKGSLAAAARTFTSRAAFYEGVIAPFAGSSLKIAAGSVIVGTPAYLWNTVTGTYQVANDENNSPYIIDKDGKPAEVDGLSAYVFSQGAKVIHSITGDPYAEKFSQAMAAQSITQTMTQYAQNLEKNPNDRINLIGRAAAVPIYFMQTPLSFAEFPITLYDNLAGAQRRALDEGKGDIGATASKSLLYTGQTYFGAAVGMYSMAGDVFIAGPVNTGNEILLGGDGKVLKSGSAEAALAYVADYFSVGGLLGLQENFQPVNPAEAEYPTISYSVANAPFFLNPKGGVSDSVLGKTTRTESPSRAGSALNRAKNAHETVMKPVHVITVPLNRAGEIVGGRVFGKGTVENKPIVPDSKVESDPQTTENKPMAPDSKVESNLETPKVDGPAKIQETADNKPAPLGPEPVILEAGKSGEIALNTEVLVQIGAGLGVQNVVVEKIDGRWSIQMEDGEVRSMEPGKEIDYQFDLYSLKIGLTSEGNLKLTNNKGEPTPIAVTERISKLSSIETNKKDFQEIIDNVDASRLNAEADEAFNANMQILSSPDRLQDLNRHTSHDSRIRFSGRIDEKGNIVEFDKQEVREYEGRKNGAEKSTDVTLEIDVTTGEIRILSAFQPEKFAAGLKVLDLSIDRMNKKTTKAKGAVPISAEALAALKERINSDVQDTSVKEFRNRLIDRAIVFIKGTDIEKDTLKKLETSKNSRDVYNTLRDKLYDYFRVAEYDWYNIESEAEVMDAASRNDFVVDGKTMVRSVYDPGWFYRIPLSGEGTLGRTNVRMSLNVYAQDGIIGVLDKFFVKNNIDGNYKVPDDLWGWHDRHDPITIYLNDRLTDAQLQEFKEITAPYIRADEAVFVGEKLAPGITFDMEATAERCRVLEHEAREVDPELADYINRYSFYQNGEYRIISAGNYAALKLIIELGKGEISVSEAVRGPDSSISAEQSTPPVESRVQGKDARAEERLGGNIDNTDARDTFVDNKQGSAETSIFSRDTIPQTMIVNIEHWTKQSGENGIVGDWYSQHKGESLTVDAVKQGLREAFADQHIVLPDTDTAVFSRNGNGLLFFDTRIGEVQGDRVTLVPVPDTVYSNMREYFHADSDMQQRVAQIVSQTYAPGIAKMREAQQNPREMQDLLKEIETGVNEEKKNPGPVACLSVIERKFGLSDTSKLIDKHIVDTRRIKNGEEYIEKFFGVPVSRISFETIAGSGESQFVKRSIVTEDGLRQILTQVDKFLMTKAQISEQDVQRAAQQQSEASVSRTTIGEGNLGTSPSDKDGYVDVPVEIDAKGNIVALDRTEITKSDPAKTDVTIAVNRKTGEMRIVSARDPEKFASGLAILEKSINENNKNAAGRAAHSGEMRGLLAAQLSGTRALKGLSYEQLEKIAGQLRGVEYGTHAETLQSILADMGIDVTLGEADSIIAGIQGGITEEQLKEMMERAKAEKGREDENKPLAVIVQAESDWNGAFQNTDTHVEQLKAKGYDVQHKIVRTVAEAEQFITEVTAIKPASLLMIAGHGVKDRLVFSGSDPLSMDVRAANSGYSQIKAAEIKDLLQEIIAEHPDLVSLQEQKDLLDKLSGIMEIPLHDKSEVDRNGNAVKALLGEFETLLKAKDARLNEISEGLAKQREDAEKTNNEWESKRAALTQAIIDLDRRRSELQDAGADMSVTSVPYKEAEAKRHERAAIYQDEGYRKNVATIDAIDAKAKPIENLFNAIDEFESGLDKEIQGVKDYHRFQEQGPSLDKESIKLLSHVPERLTENAVVVLESCSTGSTKSEGANLQDMVSEMFKGRTILAPEYNAKLVALIFNNRGEVVDLKYIPDKTEHSRAEQVEEYLKGIEAKKNQFGWFANPYGGDGSYLEDYTSGRVVRSESEPLERALDEKIDAAQGDVKTILEPVSAHEQKESPSVREGRYELDEILAGIKLCDGKNYIISNIAEAAQRLVVLFKSIEAESLEGQDKVSANPNIDKGYLSKFKEQLQGKYPDILLWTFVPDVGEFKGKIMGYIKVRLINDTSAEIENVAVDKVAQGSGVGTQLVQTAVDHLKEQGITSFKMNAISEGSRLIAKKLGWEKVADDGKTATYVYEVAKQVDKVAAQKDAPNIAGKEQIAEWAKTSAAIKDQVAVIKNKMGSSPLMYEQQILDVIDTIDKTLDSPVEQETHVSNILQGVITRESIHRNVEMYKQKIQLDCPEGIIISPDKIEVVTDIAGNLVRNAIQNTKKEHASIEIKVEESDRGLSISFTNNEPIQKDLRENIFKEKSESEKTLMRTLNAQSTGFGLPYVYARVKDLGGEMSYDLQNADTKTIFRVDIPDNAKRVKSDQTGKPFYSVVHDLKNFSGALFSYVDLVKELDALPGAEMELDKLHELSNEFFEQTKSAFSKAPQEVQKDQLMGGGMTQEQIKGLIEDAKAGNKDAVRQLNAQQKGYPELFRAQVDALNYDRPEIDSLLKPSVVHELEMIWAHLSASGKEKPMNLMKEMFQNAMKGDENLVLEVKDGTGTISVELQFDFPNKKMTITDTDGVKRTCLLSDTGGALHRLGDIYVAAKFASVKDDTLSDKKLTDVLAEQLGLDEALLRDESMEKGILVTYDASSGQYDVVETPVKRGVTFTFRDDGNLYQQHWVGSPDKAQSAAVNVVSEGHFHPQAAGSEMLSLQDIIVMVGRAQQKGEVVPEIVVTAKNNIDESYIVVKESSPQVPKQLVLTQYTFDYAQLPAIEAELKKAGTVPDEQLRDEIREQYISFQRIELPMGISTVRK